jgi:hypothetical protein
MSEEQYDNSAYAYDNSAYAVNANSAYAINEDGSFAYFYTEPAAQQPKVYLGASFGYSREDYLMDEPESSSAQGGRVEQPKLLPTRPQDQISAMPSLKIGPEPKAMKAGPQKTANSMNIVPYPDGYVPKRAVTSTRIITSTPTTYFQPAKKVKANKKMAVRAAGGTIWEDKSMMNWDANDYRLFVGNMGNEVTSELLNRYSWLI